MNWRFFLKHRILDALLKEPTNIPDGAEAITTAYQALRQRLPELPEIAP